MSYIPILNLARVVLTSSQVKNLHGTPITIVAAPGSGKVIIPVKSQCKLTYGSNVFVAGAAQTINLYWNSSKLCYATFMTNAAIVAASNNYSFSVDLSGGSATNQADTLFENTAITIYNSVATEISGNAANDNTISFYLSYYIMTV